MALPRSVICLIIFGILTTVSIYWSFLQSEIENSKTFQSTNGITPASQRRPPPQKNYLLNYVKSLRADNITKANTSPQCTKSSISDDNSEEESPKLKLTTFFIEPKSSFSYFVTQVKHKTF